jgi:hypothetical protein
VTCCKLKQSLESVMALQFLSIVVRKDSRAVAAAPSAFRITESLSRDELPLPANACTKAGPRRCDKSIGDLCHLHW